MSKFGNRFVVAAALVAGGLVGGAALVGSPASVARAEVAAQDAAASYKIDPVHSSVSFRVKHNGVNDVIGTFSAPQGLFRVGGAGGGAIEVSVNAATVSSGNPKRDEHLRSNDYFAAGQHPTISFKAGKITAAGEGTWTAEGEMTLRGVSKPLTVTLKTTGDQKALRGNATVRGVEGTFTIKRSEFGMTEGIPAVGDEVTLTVSLQAVKE